MALAGPDEPAVNLSADAQPGTWLDGCTEPSDSQRPRLVARKSRCRLEDLPGVQSIANGEELDPIVRQLGIGWKRLTETERSAVAGSETYIRRQYDMIDPHIVLHHEGLGLHLVKTEPPTAQGYWTQWWLFREDLNSCRFLCNDEAQLFSRLSHKRCDERGHWVPDIKCEGPEVFAKDHKPSEQSVPSFKQVVFDGPEGNMAAEAIGQPGEDVEMGLA